MRYLTIVAQLCVDPTGSIPDPSLPTISLGPPIRTRQRHVGRSRTTPCLGVCSTTHLRDPAGQTTCQVKIARRRTHDDQERRHVLADKRSTSALTSRPKIALPSRRSDCPETPAKRGHPATEEGVACMLSQAGRVIQPLGAKPVPLGTASQSVSPRLGRPMRLNRSDSSGH
jgi:hypothetical protein